MSHRYHLPPSAHTTFVADRFVVCSFVPRPFETDPGAMKVPFFHNNDDYDEVIFYHARQFLQPRQHPSRHDHAASRRLHARPASQGAQERVPAGRSRPPTKYAVMIDTRDALEIAPLPRRSSGPATSTAGRPRREHDEARHAQARRARRRASSSSAAISRAAGAVPGIAPTLQAALDDWATVAPQLARSAPLRSSAARATDAMRVRPGAMRRAVAARLSLGRRQRLRQPRRAGAQGARRRDAGVASGPIR